MDESLYSTSITEDYPPPKHLLRDLQITLEIQGSRQATIHTPVLRSACNDQGSMHVGLIGTLVDIVGGSVAIRAVSPDWIATSSMSIRTINPAKSGIITISGSPIRIGRNMVLTEIKIFQSSKKSDQVEIPIGSAIMVVTRLPRREENLPIGYDKNQLEILRLTSNRTDLMQTFQNQIGLRVLDTAGGVVEVKRSDYICNSFHALHGGMFAYLGDIAGQYAARAATGNPLMTRDLEIHYLELGKKGPFQTRCKILRITRDSCLTRVELIDTGEDDRLLAVIMNTAASDHDTTVIAA